MLKAYWVGVGIFSIGESLLLLLGSLLSPGQRIQLRRIIVGLSLLLPFGTAFIPEDLRPVLPVVTISEIPFDFLDETETTKLMPRPFLKETPSTPTFSLDWVSILQWVVWIGMAFQVFRLFCAFASLRRFVRESTPWNLDEHTHVYTHPRACVPFSALVGRRSVVVLPQWMKSDVCQARVAILHEQQHIFCSDPFWVVIFKQHHPEKDPRRNTALSAAMPARVPYVHSAGFSPPPCLARVSFPM